MYVWGLTKEELQECADTTGVEIKFGNPKGNAQTVTLRWRNNGNGNTYRHKSISWSHERWTNKACFHGHFDFMYEVFNKNKTARIKSSFYGTVDFNGFDQFVEKVPDYAGTQIGAPIMGGYPSLIESCECGAFGYGIKHDI